MYCPVCMLPDRSRKAKRWRPCSRRNILRNDSHYLLYEEKMAEDHAPCRSRIKFRDHLLELTRQGTAEMHMIFEENKRHMIPYNTPYGQLMLGIETSRVLVEEQEDQIHVTVEYTLDHEGEPLSESCLKIHIREK